jgi:hypothetical protein
VSLEFVLWLFAILLFFCFFGDPEILVLSQQELHASKNISDNLVWFLLQSVEIKNKLVLSRTINRRAARSKHIPSTLSIIKTVK